MALLLFVCLFFFCENRGLKPPRTPFSKNLVNFFWSISRYINFKKLSHCQKALTKSRLFFFLVCWAKRPRHANDHARDWRRETGEALFSSRAAALVSRVSWLPRSMLSRACTSLTNSEEKERLLAFYKKHGYTLEVYSRYVPSNYLISWDSRDCNLKKGAFGRSEVMRVTIGVYDLVGAPLCRIALYCFRDAVYCETTNARDWVKLHDRNRSHIAIGQKQWHTAHAQLKNFALVN